MLETTDSIIVWLFILGPFLLILLCAFEVFFNLSKIKKLKEEEKEDLPLLKRKTLLFSICIIKNILTYVFSFIGLKEEAPLILDTIAWILYCLFPFEMSLILFYEFLKVYHRHTKENTKHLILFRIILFSLSFICLCLVVGTFVFILGLFMIGL